MGSSQASAFTYSNMAAKTLSGIIRSHSITQRALDKQATVELTLRWLVTIYNTCALMDQYYSISVDYKISVSNKCVNIV